MPRIVKPTPDMIAEAVQQLRSGEVVAFPTETVYGLGADTFNPDALQRIYELKGRPFNNPLIAHVLDWEQATQLVKPLPKAPHDSAAKLLNRLTSSFWPGPLTLVVQKSDAVPARATAGLPTIAIRSPAHPAARALLASFGSPISAPSANRSGHVSPTTAHHVASDFSEIDDLLILDGGPCEVGIESTVLDLTSRPPRVFRPGSISVEQLESLLGHVESPRITEQIHSPGTSAQHYAPQTLAEIVPGGSRLAAELQRSGSPVVVLTFDPAVVTSPHRSIVMPHSPAEYARELYRALREADAMHCARIVIEAPPQDHRWRAIWDRLQRAAARSTA
jgi:L-threonylcarbamoyladenylate synthase